MFARFLGIILIASLSSSAFAGTSAGYGMGGPFAPYERIIAQENASGELFRIQGHCQSSCTMFLGIRNVCVERSANLLFHAGKQRGVVTPAATARMTVMYNSALRNYVESNHYMDTLTFHTIPGRMIIDSFGYRECPRR
jgi:hypothetical protein